MLVKRVKTCIQRYNVQRYKAMLFCKLGQKKTNTLSTSEGTIDTCSESCMLLHVQSEAYLRNTPIR